uniref:Aldehyde dehydrogenase 4 family, member A1 n=1 Tax=Sinocyclocheilus anshuiensis TaxID=1608454 RepID=A0A671RPE3_9TELE
NTSLLVLFLCRFKTFPCAAVEVKNEPILGFREGSKERLELEKALQNLKGKTEEIPCVVGNEEVWTKDIRYRLSPFNHSHKVSKFCYADKELINKAIEASVAARREWDLKPVADRAQIFFKAADTISGPKRADVLAKTMIGQGKTVVQAEIDAAAELIDFFRFNAKHAMELEQQQPLDSDGSTNTMLYRGLEGFVAAVAPFNFTAIGGNLAGTPAIMVRCQVLFILYSALCNTGCLINRKITMLMLHKSSIITFKRLWKQVAQNLDIYRNFPRVAGECGGKNFHFVHKSAEVRSVVTGSIRSAFEYGGQKCSACSRMYVPDSLWPQIKQQLLDVLRQIKVGDVSAESFASFSRSRLNAYQRLTDSKDPEIFGPILTIYVYPEKDYKKVLHLIDNTSPYALTGAIFSQDKAVIDEAGKALRNAQPFGGARASGTNNKPGGPHYVLRWMSPQVFKQTHVPLTEWKYPYMG